MDKLCIIKKWHVHVECAGVRVCECASVRGVFEICLIINSLRETKSEKLSMHRYVCEFGWAGYATIMYGHESMAHGYWYRYWATTLHERRLCAMVNELVDRESWSPHDSDPKKKKKLKKNRRRRREWKIWAIYAVSLW